MSETFLAACALRSADATTPAAMGLPSLSDETIGACLGAITSWQSAAAAAAVCRTWRTLLKEGNCWPLEDHSSAPAHWCNLRRFGAQREGARTFAHPARWAAPARFPSWTWALNAFPEAQY